MEEKLVVVNPPAPVRPESPDPETQYKVSRSQLNSPTADLDYANSESDEGEGSAAGIGEDQDMCCISWSE
ncbi:hypothetical protein C5167_047307 [Papaver somniferum]|uniref:Uncharacterized protein n=1 Tax=Papaver somniferum TaxID=3469 RepID=A0A4Y7LH03_PAPSO|nr:hypothetical protein C5167_047307 [Papaver somniferum]